MDASAPAALRLLSSMATRLWLAEALPAHERLVGMPVTADSMGGVEAARRVRAGDHWDVVFLAADAIEALIAEGWLRADTRMDVVRSEVAVAVPAGAPRPPLSTEEDLQRAVSAARAIGYSTGPSGTQLLRLFERWGLQHTLAPRLVQAPAGVPVAQLLAEGRVSLGFQQTSELIHAPGIEVLGPLPGACAITSVFSAAVARDAQRPEAAAALVRWLAGEGTAEGKRRQGLAPA